MGPAEGGGVQRRRREVQLHQRSATHSKTHRKTLQGRETTRAHCLLLTLDTWLCTSRSCAKGASAPHKEPLWEGGLRNNRSERRSKEGSVSEGSFHGTTTCNTHTQKPVLPWPICSTISETYDFDFGHFRRHFRLRPISTSANFWAGQIWSLSCASSASSGEVRHLEFECPRKCHLKLRTESAVRSVRNSFIEVISVWWLRRVGWGGQRERGGQQG